MPSNLLVARKQNNRLRQNLWFYKVWLIRWKWFALLRETELLQRKVITIMLFSDRARSSFFENSKALFFDRASLSFQKDQITWVRARSNGFSLLVKVNSLSYIGYCLLLTTRL